jgi:hypothetical protein
VEHRVRAHEPVCGALTCLSNSLGLLGRPLAHVLTNPLRELPIGELALGKTDDRFLYLVLARRFIDEGVALSS